MDNATRIKILRNLKEFKGEETVIAPLHGGMTNHNYLVTAHGKNYVARFAPVTLPLLGLNRRREIHNYRFAASIGVGADVLVHYPAHRLLIVEHIRGEVLPPQSARKPQTIAAVAQVLKKLHTKPGIAGPFDPVTRIAHYIKIVKMKHGRLPESFPVFKEKFDRALKAAGPFSRTTSCHLDLMLENIIMTPQGKAMLLDWEYASKADHRYDLAMFSVKGKFGEKEDRLIADAYGKGGKEYLKTKDATKTIVHFAEGMYGILQDTIAKQKKVDYRGYAMREFGEM